MCGFAGIVNFTSPDPPAIDEALLRRMGEPVARRGPDGTGLYISPDRRVGLIHHRLAIVDIASGAQPMCNEDGTVWVVFNGEIYNHVELRADLERLGHRFKTDHCDTETLVHAYEQYGAECPEHFRGQFAFAVVDLNARSVFLARDRLGQKPLYCGESKTGGLVFASNPRCLLASGQVNSALETGNVCDYLRLGYTPDILTIWRDLYRMSPGWSKLFKDNKHVNDTYWGLPLHGSNWSAEAATRLVRRRLVEATELRLRADVEVGLFLSGGIDSAVVAAIVRRELDRPIRTFTIGTPDPSYDEREPARRVAKELGCEHAEFEVQPDHLLDVLDDLIETVGEPFADSSIVPTHWVARLTRPHVKVALSGDGGDEAFAGYDRYQAIRLAHRLQWGRPFWRLGGLLSNRLGGGGHRDRLSRLARFLTGAGMDTAHAYRHWVSLFTETQLHRLIRDDYFLGPIGFGNLAEDFQAEIEYFPDAVQAAIRIDYGSYLPDDILTKVDRASMAVALEVRSPFLDHHVVELAISLPSYWKLRGRTSKWILREAFRDIVPPSVWTQPKRGFGLPLDRWFRQPDDVDPQAGRLLPLLRESVAYLPADVFDHAFIDELIGRHQAGREEHSQRLWALLWLGRWWKRFVG